MSAHPFHNKVFRILKNEGPGTEVDERTTFYFKQHGDLVEARYKGGRVRAGRLLGLLRSPELLEFRYVQVNTEGEINAGHGRDQIRRTPDGRLQLLDYWQWETQPGRGVSVMEEQERAATVAVSESGWLRGRKGTGGDSA